MKHLGTQQAQVPNTSDTQLPEKATDGIVTQQIGAETLIYDEATHKAYCLNATAAAVWAACDGKQTVAAIAKKVTVALAHPASEDLVLLTLSELQRDGLLDTVRTSTALPLPSRRVLLQKLGAGAALLLPAIAVLSAPKAAHALSGTVCTGCTG